MAETQRPINAEQIGAGHGVFQIMWRDESGHLYVHQMKGSDVRMLALNTPESKQLREKLFWHMKASFLSNVAAVFGLDPIEVEAEPVTPLVVKKDGTAYNPGNGGIVHGG